MSLKLIESVFLKNDTSIHTLNIEAKGLEDIHNGRRIKIKLEVDTNPPLKFQTESKTLLLPMTFNIRTMTLPNLYAGKMYALLFRNWKTRVSGNFNKDILTKEEFAKLLHDKIDTLDIKQAINEVKGFVKDARVFDFWSKDYFRLLVSRVVFSS